MTLVGEGKHTYEWIERWATIPASPSSSENGRTHGVVTSRTGAVLVFRQANPAVLVYNEDGKLMDAWGDRFLGAHGMTLVEENGKEFLWLTDQDSGEVVKTTLDGKILMNLEKPPHPSYKKGKFVPTWVAVFEERYGGNGDIWVADGYGMNLDTGTTDLAPMWRRSMEQKEPAHFNVRTQFEWNKESLASNYISQTAATGGFKCMMGKDDSNDPLGPISLCLHPFV